MIGRNAPCPCGSGKKFKKCCLVDVPRRSVLAPKPKQPVVAYIIDDGLDDLSNSVLDLIKAGKLDEAERVSNQLLRDFPDVTDGLDRLALVAEARGDKRKAAQLYRELVALIGDDPDYETGPVYQAEAERLERELREAEERTAEERAPNEEIAAKEHAP